MNLSRHFHLNEFLRSQVAARNGIDMSPPVEVIANLTHLCREVLDPIRDAANAPIVVTSGYRPERLNRLIGGSSVSDHIRGLAADIVSPGNDVDWLLGVIRGLDIPLKQCIVEYGQWIHVSIDLSAAPRREFLTARLVDGRTVYERQA